MAIFEKEDKKEQTSYVAMLDSNGDMVAFIQPVKGISQELITEALLAKGLTVEIRESKADRTEVSL